MKAWTQEYMVWVQQICFAQMAQKATKLDHLHEVEHMDERVLRLEQAHRGGGSSWLRRRYRN